MCTVISKLLTVTQIKQCLWNDALCVIGLMINQIVFCIFSLLIQERVLSLNPLWRKYNSVTLWLCFCESAMNVLFILQLWAEMVNNCGLHFNIVRVCVRVYTCNSCHFNKSNIFVKFITQLHQSHHVRCLLSLLTPLPLPLMPIPVGPHVVAPRPSSRGLQELQYAFFLPVRERCSSRNKHIHWWRKDKEVLCLYTSLFHLRTSGTLGLQGGASRSLGPVGKARQLGWL